MPDVIIINDDASFVSSSAASFTLAQQTFRVSSRPLRRQKTVRQLRRWVSKRMSRSFDCEAHEGNELSEKNLNHYHRAAWMCEGNDTHVDQPSTPAQPPRNVRSTQIGAIAEMSDDEGPRMKPQDTDTHLQMSYVAFCHRFTLSGSPETKRPFSLMADTEDEPCVEEHMAITPSAPSSSTKEFSTTPTLISDPQSNYPHGQNQASTSPAATKDPDPRTDQPFIPCTDVRSHAQDPGPRAVLAEQKTPDLHSQLSPPHYLQPPPQVMTPLVYMEHQRAARERKRLGRQKLLGPLRFLFIKGGFYEGRRYEVG